MSDYFIHNGDSFLPEYLPGIIGYGQKGAPGNTGDKAPSVYYSSLDLSSSSPDYKTAKKRILANLQLSNNLQIKNEGEYMVNDIIIDKTGSFYKISKLNKADVVILPCANTSAASYSPVTTSFSGFSVKCTTSFLKSSDKKWMKNNPNYDGELVRLNYSPKVYHHNRLEKNVYGNTITFNLIRSSIDADISMYTYKFVLVLPNGRTFDFYSDNNVCSIFLENKLLFGCFSNNEWRSLCDFNSSKVKATALSKLISSEELEMAAIDAELKKFSYIDPMKYVGEEFKQNSFDYNNTGETGVLLTKYYYRDTSTFLEYADNQPDFKDAPNVDSDDDKLTFAGNYDHLEDFLKTKEITIILSYFIKYECTAYCEITDTNTGVVYRIDINDIFINKNLVQNNNGNQIKETTNSVEWNNGVIKNTDTSNKNSNFLTYKHIKNGKEETKLFNPMNAYVMFATEDDITSSTAITEDGIIQKLYFVDATGFTDYLKVGAGTESVNIEAGLPLDGFYIKDVEENCSSNGYKVDLENKDEFAVNDICEMWGVKQLNVPVLDDDGNEMKDNGVPLVQKEFRDSNRYIRVSFSNLSSIKINIKYTKFARSASVSGEEYPQALVYIGYIDHPLIVLPAEEPNEKDEEPGIYYLTKFVPPGYYINANESDYTKTVLAGMTESTINIADFGINDTKIHYLEIGVTLLNTENKTRKEINDLHRKSYFRKSDDYKYLFMSSETSGEPDIEIFISGAKELSDEELARPDDEEIYINDFNQIHCDKPKDIIE